MTTKTITFAPPPDEGTWVLTIGSYSTPGLDYDLSAFGDAGSDINVVGQMRKSIALGLTVAGNYETGFEVSFNSSLGALSVNTADLRKRGGTVTATRHQAATPNVPEIHRIQLPLTGVGGEWQLGSNSVPWNASEITVLANAPDGVISVQHDATNRRYDLTYSGNEERELPLVDGANLLLSVTATVQ
jgi:hypothetical protein